MAAFFFASAILIRQICPIQLLIPLFIGKYYYLFILYTNNKVNHLSLRALILYHAQSPYLFLTSGNVFFVYFPGFTGACQAFGQPELQADHCKALQVFQFHKKSDT